MWDGQAVQQHYATLHIYAILFTLPGVFVLCHGPVCLLSGLLCQP